MGVIIGRAIRGQSVSEVALSSRRVIDALDGHNDQLASP
jgi:hypothetical protein